jgi:glucose-1-phosphate cytidylyltransferase
MKVVIMCGGVGSRLKEETEARPKPMVKIGEYPILYHIMKHYAHYGFKEFILALGYKGDMIKDYFLQLEYQTHDITITTGSNSSVEIHKCRSAHDDWKITLVNTGLNTLKGGRLKRIEKFLGDDERFMMTYGDGVSDVNLHKLLNFHRSHGKKVTLTGVIPTMRFGEVFAQEDGTIRFREKDPGHAAFINGGYFVIERSVLDLLSPDENQDFEIGPLEDLSDEGEVMMNRHWSFWHCMDNIRDVNALNGMWNSGEAPWKIW